MSDFFPTPPSTAASWETQLRSVALAVLGRDFASAGHQAIEHFRDESGNRPGVINALGTWALGLPLLTKTQTSEPDVALWTLIHKPVSEAAASAVNALLSPRTDGPLLELPSETSLEVRTETELSALHALSWLMFKHARNDWASRCNAAIDWHIAETQPDNATNHPWAAHAFLRRWIRAKDVSSRMFAETLIHNCQVTLGRPDRLSALILLDAANALHDQT